MIQTSPPLLQEGPVRLREITLEDAANLYKWRMSPENRRFFASTGVVSFEEHLGFVMRYFEAANTDCWFVVEVKGEPAGMIALYNVNPEQQQAEWGRFILEPAQRGHGYGRIALQLLMSYARMIGVRHLFCEVLSGNVAAEKLYRSLGFIEIGHRIVEGRRFLHLRAQLGDTGFS